MIGSLVNYELERMWKEAVVAQFKVATTVVIFWRDSGRLQEISVRTAGVRLEIWTRKVLNTKQQCQPLDRDLLLLSLSK
jgi:hypothetical protein